MSGGKKYHPSPEAAQALVLGEDITGLGSYGDFEEAMGETDCSDGCVVEPDGVCPHGYLSAGRTAGVI
jgi:hypothetical protein